jgi:hypothetical protein
MAFLAEWHEELQSLRAIKIFNPMKIPQDLPPWQGAQARLRRNPLVEKFFASWCHCLRRSSLRHER